MYALLLPVCCLDPTVFLSYTYRMNKQALSVSLDPDNVVWLRAQTRSTGCRSVSELLDRLIREARTGSQEKTSSVRSVVGRIKIAISDPDLSSADAAIRELFSTALRASRAQQSPKG